MWDEGRRRRTAFTICCSCSDMPALGFMPGIAPGLLGKAMLGVGVEGGGLVDVKETAARCEAAAQANFCGCGVGAEDGSFRPGLGWVV